MAKIDILLAVVFSISYCVILWKDWLPVASQTVTREIVLRVFIKSAPLIFIMRSGFDAAWTLQGPKEAKYGRGVILGLFAGMFGVILSELGSVRGHFNDVAMLAFLIAHCCFIYSFALRTDLFRLSVPSLLLCALPWAALVLGALWLLQPSASAPLPILRYAHLSAAFLLGWSATLRVGRSDSSPTSQHFGLVGAALAIAADIAPLALRSLPLDSDISYPVAASLVYYLGQMSLSLSIEHALVLPKPVQKNA